ncbi:P-loop containing nucleoside triphosphate hydrolase protein [Leptodontidium sp. 2 PMI_412]|nr:P-loop containing nucleoside triphosphate hydrolase protein [Leptodontidium sp. 2 PMI_412]
MDANDFHLAICGSSGSGKSSLLNALMGIANGTNGAAATGQNETTTEIRPYYQPENNNNNGQRVMYDCPGAGTVSVPAENYFYHQHLYLFDCIILVHSGRFTEVDIAVLKACQRHNTKVIIVRSKSDVAIRAEADDNGISIPQAHQNYITSASGDVRRQLAANGLEEMSKEKEPVYLVNKDDLRHAVLGEGFTEFWTHENQFLERLTGGWAELVRVEDERAEHEVEHEEEIEEIDASGFEGGKNGADNDGEMEQLIQYGDENEDKETEGEEEKGKGKGKEKEI